MAAGGLLAHREGDRGFPWLWFVRAVGLVITIITLGLTATGAASFGSIGCNSPAKLNFNVAVTVLSFIGLVYILLATGPTRPLKILPWFIFGQLALDALLFIFWLAAAASSSISCDELCAACNGIYSEVLYGNQDCLCFTIPDDTFLKGKRSPATSANPANSLLTKRRGHSGGGSHSDSSSNSGTGTGDAVISFDSIMTILTAFCLAATILWFTQDAKHNRQRTANPSGPVAGPSANEPIKHEEAGITPPVYPPGTYQQQPPMQQQQQQQQPTMHQVPYNPTHQQEQYQTSTPAAASNFSTSPPPPTEGTAEMPHVNQPPPAVYGQTPG